MDPVKKKKRSVDFKQLSHDESLVFDDDVIAEVDSGAKKNATPASLIEQWKTGYDRTDELASTIIEMFRKSSRSLRGERGLLDLEPLLSKRIEAEVYAARGIGEECAFLRNVLANVAYNDGSFEVALQEFQEMYTAAKERFGKQSSRTLLAGQRVVRLLRELGRSDEAAKLDEQLNEECEDTKRREFELKQSGWNRRFAALELYNKDRFEEAEALYLELVDEGFDLGSTHVHLVRLYLKSNRTAKAKEHLDRAFKNRSQSGRYVLNRILFLYVFFGLLDREDVSRIVKVIYSFSLHSWEAVDWTIGSMVERFREQLLESDYEFLMILARYVSRGGSESGLEDFEYWKDASVTCISKAVTDEESETLEEYLTRFELVS